MGYTGVSLSSELADVRASHGARKSKKRGFEPSPADKTHVEPSVWHIDKRIHLMAGCKKSRANRPKMKTNRAAAKRFSVTGTGKVKFSSKGHRHILSNKSRKKKRQQRKANIMCKGDAQLVARQIPYLM